MAKILENITLENYRGHSATSIKKINNLLMLVGKNDIGKSSVLEALDAFFNTGDIKDADYCQTTNATELSIKCKINSNKYELKANKNTGQQSYSKDGNPFYNRWLFKDDIQSIHYTLFRADNTNATKYNDQSVTNFVQEIQNENTYKEYLKDNFLDEKISVLVNNTLKIADSFRKLKDFFQQSDMQEYYKDINEDKNFTILENDKEQLLTKLREFHFSDSQIETEKEDFFQKLFEKNNIYNLETVAIALRVNDESRYKDDFDNWFITTELKDIKSESIDWNIVQKYEHEQELRKKPFYEIESILKPFEGNSSPIEKRGSGVKRLCAFYQFAISSKTVFQTINDKYILAIEEPEISLHPDQQRKFIQQLLDISQNDDIQVIVTTHSPIIVKEMGKKINYIRVLTSNGIENLTGNRKKCIIKYNRSGKDTGYISINEINYIAFDEPSIEYHIELFGYMQEITNIKSVSGLDTWLEHKTVDPSLRRDENGKVDGFVDASNQLVKKVGCWTRVGNSGGHRDGDLEDSTLPVCVRNNIDHPDPRNDKKFKNKVGRSIKLMRSVIVNDTTTFPIP